MEEQRQATFDLVTGIRDPVSPRHEIKVFWQTGSDEAWRQIGRLHLMTCTAQYSGIWLSLHYSRYKAELDCWTAS